MCRQLCNIILLVSESAQHHQLYRGIWRNELHHDRLLVGSLDDSVFGHD